jgi:predicted component of type VI protein secretion system
LGTSTWWDQLHRHVGWAESSAAILGWFSGISFMVTLEVGAPPQYSLFVEGQVIVLTHSELDRAAADRFRVELVG